MSSSPCVYCHRGDPPPKYGFRARCRVCGREYLAPFPGHGSPTADPSVSPLGRIRPIPTPPTYHYETTLGPEPKPAIAPPRPKPAGPQSAMEFD